MILVTALALPKSSRNTAVTTVLAVVLAALRQTSPLESLVKLLTGVAVCELEAVMVVVGKSAKLL